MALLTAMSLADARRVGAAFGLDVARADALAEGSVNSNFRLTARDGKRWFARVYEEQAVAGARAELALVRALAAHGVSTPEPLPGEADHAGKPVAIYPWVDGEILCQARVTPQACARVGEALASIHLSGVEPPGEGRFRVADIEARLDGIEASAFAAEVPPIREHLRRAVALRENGLAQGLIHGDLFRDNVLWQGGQLVALIDFESASRGPFAYDVMVTLLAWCCGDHLDPDLMRAFLTGYHARRPLTPREINALAAEGRIACLRFATTRITDFAMRAPPGKPAKRDFRRFLSRLEELESGVLEPLVDVLRS